MLITAGKPRLVGWTITRARIQETCSLRGPYNHWSHCHCLVLEPFPIRKSPCLLMPSGKDADMTFMSPWNTFFPLLRKFPSFFFLLPEVWDEGNSFSHSKFVLRNLCTSELLGLAFSFLSFSFSFFFFSQFFCNHLKAKCSFPPEL